MLADEELKFWYEQNKKQCLYCGKDIQLGDKGFSWYKNRKFCNSSCAASYNNVNRSKDKYESILVYKDGHYIKDTSKKYCLNCGKELNYPIQRKN